MASPPLYMTPVPAEDIERAHVPDAPPTGVLVREFVEGYCRVTKESVGGSAGSLIRFRDWQSNISQCIYARRADRRLRHRQALIGLPRKNGKSAIGSSFALHGLVMSDPGSEVYSCAADKEQARIVFGVAKRMVELDPELSDIIKPYRDALEYKQAGSVYKVLSSEAFTKEGLNPTTIIYDELHAAPTDELYNVMTLAQGSRKNPLFIAITTAGVKYDQTGAESICYRLYQHGVAVSKNEIEDPTFYMAWWGAPEGADYKDEAVWAAANPGYDDLIDPDDFRSVVKRVHENEFRTKRLNQWVSSKQAWLPQGAWDACRTDREFTPGRKGVVLGFDGSRTGDMTALVAVTVTQDPQVIVLGTWRKPRDAEADWKVPRGQVKDRIRQACKDYDVREVAADEYIWQDSLEELADEGIPVVAFPQTPMRMIPATQRMYTLVASGSISHDGNPVLASHFDNCNLKTDNRGSRVVKDSHNSPRKIDLAVATIMACDRAAFWLNEPEADSIGGVPIRDIQFVW
jgi:phage terminase large subunit-like protein